MTAFISYNHDDEYLASWLVGLLEQEGILVWWYRRHSGGGILEREIEKAIDTCDRLVVLLGPNGLSEGQISEIWQGRPRTRETPGSGKTALTVIPVSLGGKSPGAMNKDPHTTRVERALLDYNWIDFSEGDRDENWSRLVRFLVGSVPTRVLHVPEPPTHQISPKSRLLETLGKVPIEIARVVPRVGPHFYSASLGDPESVFGKMAHLAAELFQADYVTILVPRRDGRGTYYDTVSRFAREPGRILHETGLQVRAELGTDKTGVINLAAQRRSLVAVPDVARKRALSRAITG